MYLAGTTCEFRDTLLGLIANRPWVELTLWIPKSDRF